MHRNHSSGGFVARRRHQNRPEIDENRNPSTPAPPVGGSTSLLIEPASNSPATSLWNNNQQSQNLPSSHSESSFVDKKVHSKPVGQEHIFGFRVPEALVNYASSKFAAGPLTEPAVPAVLGSEEESSVSDLPAFIPQAEMPCRERTAEFRTAAKSLQMKQQAMNGYQHKPKRKLVADSVQFNQMAKRIGRDLSQTCAKVEKLAILAKKKSLFNDRVLEIDELTGIVKQDVSGLNKQIAALQQFVSTHVMTSAGPEANTSTGGRPQGQNHSRSVVVGLQSRLAAVSTEFKTVLEVRTENLKQQKSRREKFSQSQPIPSSLPPSASSGNMGSVLLSDEYAASNGFVSVDMDNLEKQRVQQQVQLIDEQDQYVQSRSNAMENIETSIVELGSIFRQLAHLVSEQGETIQRIDANVDETSVNVEAAHMELLKYFRSISSNRWLAIKVFGILIVFFIVFIIFLT